MAWRFLVRHFVSMACVAGLSIFLVMSFPLNSVAQGATQDNREPLPEAPSGTWNAVDESSRGTAWRGAGLLKRFADDQKAIWSSPLRMRRNDALWALPALAGAATVVASDSWFSRQGPAGRNTRTPRPSQCDAHTPAGPP